MKLTTWNIEHFAKLIADLSAPAHVARLKLISDQIIRMDADILCLIEAPGDLVGLRNWIGLPLDQGGLDGMYKVPTIPGTQEILDTNPANVRKALQDLYAMKGTDRTGNQWIWFLMKEDLFNNTSAEVQNPNIWQGMTGRTDWPVNYWGNYESKVANHWRHPQTLVLDFSGITVEIIGVHLKSKINRKRPFDDNGVLLPTYVDEALRARVKLATEANDVRKYIEQRFQQEPDPRIIVCGDMNDGPGKKFFERQYLFFDLISNIQGSIFLASRFLNHALFDFTEHLRWTTKFRDSIELWARENREWYNEPVMVIDNARKQLIDHILFTQAFVNDSGTPKINARAGFIEHMIHEKVNASIPDSRKTSDHRPVSVEIEV